MANQTTTKLVGARESSNTIIVKYHNYGIWRLPGWGQRESLFLSRENIYRGHFYEKWFMYTKMHVRSHYMYRVAPWSRTRNDCWDILPKHDVTEFVKKDNFCRKRAACLSQARDSSWARSSCEAQHTSATQTVSRVCRIWQSSHGAVKWWRHSSFDTHSNDPTGERRTKAKGPSLNFCRLPAKKIFSFDVSDTSASAYDSRARPRYLSRQAMIMCSRHMAG